MVPVARNKPAENYIIQNTPMGMHLMHIQEWWFWGAYYSQVIFQKINTSKLFQISGGTPWKSAIYKRCNLLQKTVIFEVCWSLAGRTDHTINSLENIELRKSENYYVNRLDLEVYLCKLFIYCITNLFEL